MNRSRYAIYYAPAHGSALDLFGSSWLGRSAHDGRYLSPPDLPPHADELRLKYLADPNRYGFHATLKPPFAMAKGESVEHLRQSLADFAISHSAFWMPPLSLRELDGFLALMPTMRSPPLEKLAADCVRHFDSFRAPPLGAELERRRSHGLTESQEANLQAWGYPYVMEDFRFHMTLTGRISSQEDRQVLFDVLAPFVESFCKEPVKIDTLSLFVEDSPGQPFYVLDRFPLNP